jgi:hypothetical protein
MLAGNCRRRIRSVARHSHAGVWLAVSAVSTDARSARRRAIWKSLSPRYGRVGRVGLAYVHRTLASRGASTSYVPIAAAAFVILANVESLRAPIQYQRFTGIPPLYGSLATEPRVVLAECPSIRDRQHSRTLNTCSIQRHTGVR